MTTCHIYNIQHYVVTSLALRKGSEINSSEVLIIKKYQEKLLKVASDSTLFDKLAKVVCKLVAVRLSTNTLENPSTWVDAVNKIRANQSQCGRGANHGGNHGRSQGDHRSHMRSADGACSYCGTKCKKGQYPAYGKTCKNCNNMNYFACICGQYQRWMSTNINHNNGPSQHGGNYYRRNQWGNCGFRGNHGSNWGYRNGHKSCRNIYEIQTNDQLLDQF